MINKDVHIFTKGQYSCLYNSITMDLIYLKNNWLSGNKPSEEICKQLPKEFTTNNDYYKEALKKIQSYLKPNIKTLFMIINEQCNLACEYCRYINKLPKNFVGQVMDETVGKGLINKFLTSEIDNESKTIVLFGTEVLQNSDLVEELAKYIREIDLKNQLSPTDITIFTNGTLINDRVVRFIKQYDITPIISIDGWEEIHDKARVNKAGKGTYKKIRKNCELLKNEGIKFGISTAVGEHNVDYLPEIIDFFIEEFDPLNVGLNPLEINDKYSKEIFFNKYIEQGLKAFEVARQKGISLPQVMRRIRPFVEQKHRLKECPTCGGALRVYPNGRIGTCSHFVAVNEYCIDYKTYINEDINSKDIFNQWSHRTQFSFNQCSNCEAISLCGGGCVYNAFLQNDEIMAPDYRICFHSKYALEWCIWKLFEYTRGANILEKQTYFKPDKKMRKLIYGNIDEDNLKLPLQKYNTFGEHLIFSY
ncbi:radical SAM/SPASM domain-containing protein [Abyssisolibacter fermentans]|uniref:radical SAM/SPASM domain-containing protein n=1 Tax=Abyssisolibacter fermentans TaxID=1766203 RepID=UPI000834446B|nr:radical SAM protein [Abyssisolibacter fermentans]